MLEKQVYDTFVGFEERCADLYLDLASRFMNDVELSWLWVEMAMEEKQHAGLLQFCRDTGVTAAHVPGSEQIQKLRELFKQLSEQAAKADLTVDEAFEIAVTLENSEINDIYDKLTAPIEGPWYILRKKIELAAHNHLDALKQAAQRFHVSPALQRRIDVMAQAETPVR